MDIWKKTKNTDIKNRKHQVISSGGGRLIHRPSGFPLDGASAELELAVEVPLRTTPFESLPGPRGLQGRQLRDPVLRSPPSSWPLEASRALRTGAQAPWATDPWLPRAPRQRPQFPLLQNGRVARPLRPRALRGRAPRAAGRGVSAGAGPAPPRPGEGAPGAASWRGLWPPLSLPSGRVPARTWPCAASAGARAPFAPRISPA